MSREILCHCGSETFRDLGVGPDLCMDIRCGKPTSDCTCASVGVGLLARFDTGPTDGTRRWQPWPQD